MNETIKKVATILFTSLIGFTSFIILGELLPRTYFRYLDNTDYYKIDKISIEDQNYKACETINISISRSIPRNIQTTYVDELVLVETNNQDAIETEIFTYAGETFWKRGEKTVVLPYKLPCDLQTGNYYIESSSSFIIEGVEKEEGFQTPVFRVIGANE